MRPMTTGRARAGAAAALAAAVLLLAGCTGGGDDEASAPDEAQDQALEDTAGELADAGGEDAEPVPVQEDLPVLAERPAVVDEQAVTVALNGVSVDEQVMSVVFTVTNDGDADAQLSTAFGDGLSSDNPFTTVAVTVLDGVNGNLHRAALTEDGTCVCSGALEGVTLPPGGSVVLTTAFTAVPEDVETVTVTIPRAGAFADVPVTR